MRRPRSTSLQKGPVNGCPQRVWRHGRKTAMAGWLEEIDRLRGEVASPSPASGISAEALYEAVALARRAASRLLTLEDWNGRLDCAGAALYLNLAEVELREALARIQWVARPVRLAGLPAGEESGAVVQGVVALLGDVVAALVAAVDDGGALAGSLPAARTIVDIDGARAALRGEPLV